MLLTKNLRLKAISGKLVPKFVKPFRVLNRVGSLTYHLYLPDKYDRLYNIFPISLLKLYIYRVGQEPLPIPELENDKEWEVEEIRDKRQINNETR